MKLQNLEVTNFGSYPHLALNLSDLGLALIYGRTGSGKSTIMDAVCWTLFGITAKDGSVDEVKSWQNSNEPTSGKISLNVHNVDFTIFRIRGKSTQNDLYWIEGDNEEPKRGKDITETQKLIEKHLGITADLYLTAGYFHEFSPSGSFFIAKSKDRRDLFEKLAPLELPKKLSEKAAEAKKITKKDHEEKENEYSRLNGKIEQIKSTRYATTRDMYVWKKNQDILISDTKALAKSFEADREAKIIVLKQYANKWELDHEAKNLALVQQWDKLNEEIKTEYYFTKKITEAQKRTSLSCKLCKQPINDNIELINRLKLDQLRNNVLISKSNETVNALKAHCKEINQYAGQILDLKGSNNFYLDQVTLEQNKINPFVSQMERLQKELEGTLKDADKLKLDLEALEAHLEALNYLYHLSTDLRAELLKNAIRAVETETNHYLEKYFDSELKVSFSLDGTDNLSMDIQKSGYSCSYKQLSKGQRQLLKLSFVVSVMKTASNKAGTHFDNLFMDEALDGLDEALKIKAFNMFQQLETEHSSVLLIDHAPAFQSMFSKKFHVTMERDESRIEEEHE